MNKPFCGQMGVQGFPTLKIVRPGKKPGKPTVEDYQGPRAAKGIVEAVKEKIPNIVKRLTDKTLDEWLKEKNETAKAILFSDKGLTSATLRTLAIDFAGVVSVAQIRNKEAGAMKTFGIEKVPTLILLPGGTKEPIVFDGELKKEAMVEFLSQIAPPNPDCPPPKAKKTKSKKEEKKTSKASKAPAADEPSESPSPKPQDEETTPPIIIPEPELKPTIPLLAESSELEASCLSPKSKTCVLALLPKDEASEARATALASLASIHKKHDARAGHLFPFFGIPATNPLSSSLLAELKLGDDNGVHLIATNAKKGWWKKYSGEGLDAAQIESWIDAIRMGEGKKEKLPAALVAEGEKAEPKKEEPVDQQPIQIEVEEIPEDKEPETQHEHSEL
jgi:protein disulfide-isomerase A6